eukprot:CAMPEP_0197628478 /NCGR_PEP_ID=MMETSP1338-20131121/6775_1 /TAXON_ID=43686 ORGANISM="Pelagodinium beii, Strain RCC1491" /NCGR_SAMPLE_ID=MMETSP1338 /ASSEMBLY_ACC=CAM_ASM_000754 /LENGTH=942 /DNA_ID=CAMNT_0043199459 /DNA_START=101 /DNA_END=2929 /DNA_ORIENTATION=-
MAIEEASLSDLEFELQDLDLNLALPEPLEPLTPRSSTHSSGPSSALPSPRGERSPLSPAISGYSESSSSRRALSRRVLGPHASDPSPFASKVKVAAGATPHPSSPLLLARSSIVVHKHAESFLQRRHSVCRAALIRANACRFADRYQICDMDDLVGEGTFGRVYCCVDKMADMKRAVKRLQLPTGPDQQELVNEIDALIALDHPAIVRLIEYFVEGSELLLVMELLQGPSLGEKMRDLGPFSERFAVRCLRHVLKALFCCHCHGIAHNDVSEENFRFESYRPEAALRMVDFGLSEVSSQEKSRSSYVQMRDIWSVGTMFYQMLSGESLFPVREEVSEQAAADLLHCATNPDYVPSRLKSLNTSQEAHDLLSQMLELSTEKRITAQEALHHPLLMRAYGDSLGEVNEAADVSPHSKSWGKGRKLSGCVPTLRAFASAGGLKRLALLVAAHLLSDEEVSKLHWIFRYIAQDVWRIEEQRFREALLECGEEVPEDFSDLFNEADFSGSGVLNFVEFMASALASQPDIYCRESSLKAVFHFWDNSGQGVIKGEHLHSLFPARTEADCAAMIKECCGKDSMTFQDFRRLMTPEGWKAIKVSAAFWADKPDRSSPSSPTTLEKNEASQEQKTHGYAQRSSGGRAQVVNASATKKVTSPASEAFAIRQVSGFHGTTLWPFYEAQPVSNVVLGLAQGTSGYARRAFALGCADVVESDCGAFFLMPNPKYHWTPEAALNAERKARFVAWWIHPDLCEGLRAWTQVLSPSGSSSSRRSGDDDAENPGVDDGVGAPGDFGYSNVAKPSGYLHTCRDLAGEAHVRMLDGIVGGIKRYLERLFGDSLTMAHVSAGFHYPVRPQYSTLHLQIRVNSGDVCPGEGRGVDFFRLLHRLRDDPQCFKRDDETLFYEATANLRMALLKACSEAGQKAKEVGPMSLVLGGNSSEVPAKRIA